MSCFLDIVHAEREFLALEVGSINAQTQAHYGCVGDDPLFGTIRPRRGPTFQLIGGSARGVGGDVQASPMVPRLGDASPIRVRRFLVVAALLLSWDGGAPSPPLQNPVTPLGPCGSGFG
jgi:hypothetical protein